MGINVQDLPDILGIGRASMFCCRTGKRPITRKTWLKLEAAERAAGIGEPDGGKEVRERNLKHPALPVGGKNSEEATHFPSATAADYQSALQDAMAQIQAALEPLRQMQAKLTAAQKTIEDFPMDELKRHMEAAGAWPN